MKKLAVFLGFFFTLLSCYNNELAPDTQKQRKSIDKDLEEYFEAYIYLTVLYTKKLEQATIKEKTINRDLEMLNSTIDKDRAAKIFFIANKANEKDLKLVNRKLEIIQKSLFDIKTKKITQQQIVQDFQGFLGRNPLLLEEFGANYIGGPDHCKRIYESCLNVALAEGTTCMAFAAYANIYAPVGILGCLAISSAQMYQCKAEMEQCRADQITAEP